MNLYQLNDKVKKYIDRSALCWLATCNMEFVPNVSPEELFTHIDDKTIVIADIASSTAIANLKDNSNVCISFLNAFVQKGYQINGTAKLIDKEEPCFELYAELLTELYTDRFSIKSLVKITITTIVEINAPNTVHFDQSVEIN